MSECQKIVRELLEHWRIIRDLLEGGELLEHLRIVRVLEHGKIVGASEVCTEEL